MRVFYLLLVVLSAVIATSSTWPLPWLPAQNGATGYRRGDFQLFVLRQQWAPEWCKIEQGMQWCTNWSSPSGADNVVLHGLWPQFDDSHANFTFGNTTSVYWPQFCGAAAVCAANASASSLCEIPTEIRNEFHEDWLKYAPAYPHNGSATPYNYGDHEWAKHATCSVLDAQRWFVTELETFRSTRFPHSLVYAIGQGPVLDLTTLLLAYAGDFTRQIERSAAFACSADGSLFAVSTCWSKTRNGTAGTRVACPDGVMRSAYSNNCVEHSGGISLREWPSRRLNNETV